VKKKKEYEHCTEGHFQHQIPPKPLLNAKRADEPEQLCIKHRFCCVLLLECG